MRVWNLDPGPRAKTRIAGTCRITTDELRPVVPSAVERCVDDRSRRTATDKEQKCKPSHER
jgi:hypothetical protein